MMPKRLLPVSIILMLVVLACSLPTVSLSQDTSDYFPLKMGAYWVYQGPVKWTKPNSAEVAEQEVTWKMEVVQVLQRENIRGYEMLGAPWDLAWYDPAKEQSKYGILKMGEKYYRVPVETVARLSNKEDDLAGLVNENTIFLDTPLETGKKFCDPTSLARSDNMYCWVVGEGTPFDASNIKGIDPSKELMEYPIGNRTMPDASIVYFAPGVGISGYAYRHGGTVSEVDVRLIEYYPGE